MGNGKPALGYIGLGLMGGPMTERLLDAGCHVTVWNRSRDKIVPALGKGAREGAFPADVARNSDIVQTCVTDGAAMEDVVFGSGGIVEGATADKILIDYSTIPPDAARDMAARLKDKTGMRWIDAPVTGGVVGARAGALVVFAGGDEADIEAVRPTVAHMAQNFTRMGPGGAGLVTKLCNQTINACVKVVLSEMLSLARDGGIDGAALPQVMKGGSADSSQLQREAPRMVARDFDNPHGTVYTIHKDLGIIADFARESGTAMPVTALVSELYRLHIAKGDGGLDSISIFKLFDRAAR